MVPVEDTGCVAVTWVWRCIPGVRAQAPAGFGLQSCLWDLWALEHQSGSQAWETALCFWGFGSCAPCQIHF